MLYKVFFIAILVMTGCGASRPPIAQYTSATIIDSYPSAVSFDVSFDLSNNNDEPLKLVEYTYTVSVDGNTVYHGFAEAQQTLPRGSTTTSSIPIVVPRAFISGQNIVVWHLKGKLDYLSHGALAETLFDSKIWQPSANFTATDSFDASLVEYVFPLAVSTNELNKTE